MTNFRNHDFSLRQLQYAMAVAETRGFGSAAEACGVSQPSLSVQVAKLEEALGTTLFERQPRGVLVTAAGKDLLAAIRGVLSATDHLGAIARTLEDPFSTPLRVGVIPTVAPYFIPAVAKQLVGERAPAMHWLELQTAACERALQDGEIDAMLVADPPSVGGVDQVAIGWEPFRVVVPEHDPLTGQIRLEDLEGRELMLLDEGHCLRDHALALCTRPDSRRSPYRATSLPTLVQMVSAGMGISVLPASAVALEAGRAPVRTLPFAEEGVGRTLHLVWRTRSVRAPVVVALADVMRSALVEVVDA